jgi:RNA polymerase sigma-70 factor (ECF subfamily)
MPPIDDHERFMRLFLQHEPEILRAVLVFVPQRADARDIVQETAVALWKHFAEYDPARPFVRWACGFARVEVRRFLRKTTRRAALTERAAEVLMASEDALAPTQAERERHLQECLANLPVEQRRMLDGYYAEEQSVEKLAQVHGRSVEAIYKMLQRIRRALLDCIERKMEESRT